jgi:hypothetical protein
MAKAPKAPGSNGAGSAQTLIDAYLAAADAYAHGDGHWTSHVNARSTGPVARLLGDGPARALLPRLAAIPGLEAEALGIIAAQLVARGDRAAAEAAAAEAAALLARDGVDGERGTIAWGSVARARHALGDEAGVDAALDAADACARRERDNPTQPWPHLALALADTGRTAKATALFRQVGRNNISFDTERAAERALAAALAAGDADALGALHEVLGRDKLYTFVTGVRLGADAAAAAGHGAVFARVLDLMKGGSYVTYVGATLSLAAAGAGDLALARAVAERARDQDEHFEAPLVDAFAALGDDAEAARLAALLPDGRRDPRSNAEALAAVLRLLRARDPAAAQARVAAAEAAAQAHSDQDQFVAQGELGLAQALAGDEAAGAARMLAAVAGADALPRTNQGWARNYSLQLLGTRYAELGRWAEGLAALKKCSAKHGKVAIVGRLANAYARAGDAPGAAMMLAYVPAATLKRMMCACDALHALIGAPTPYVNYS